MTKTRYGFSFIISVVIYGLLAISILSLANIPKILKEPKEESIKISIITPVVKKVIVPVKVPLPPVVVPPKKVKPKKIVKKKIVKKVKPKKVIKKKIVKKVKPKKIVKKKVVKKIKPKKVIKKIEPEPIFTSTIVPDEVYTHSSIVEDRPPMVYNEPQYIEAKYVEPDPIVTTPQYEPPVQPVNILLPIVEEQPRVQPVQQHNNNAAAKKAFLNNLRAKIIANKEYPKIALRRHIQGSVKVRFDLTTNGGVSNIRFLEGKTILQKGVRKAILRSFPLNVPFELQNELPMYNISVTVNFNIR